jgi:hypothetical protein
MRRAKTTEKWINKRIAKGYGQGSGKSYKPFIEVRSFSSRGLSSRIPGNKVERVHHTLSALESKYFCVLELIDNILEIKENFALLPLTKTVSIAKSLGIKHPQDSITKQNIVMTTDYLILIKINGQTKRIARTIKYTKDLSSKRVIEKFEIERIYWQRQGVDWGIVTERDIDPNLISNSEVLWPRLSLGGLKIPDLDIEKAKQILTAEIAKQEKSLLSITDTCDKTLSLQAGSSLAIAYHLIAIGILRIDLYELINPGKILKIQS